jgi:uncharacterized protein (DUF1800 family)
MAISTPRAPALTNLELMAHLYRRAGFGATVDELRRACTLGYEAAVEQLLQTEAQPPLDDFLINRYYVDVQEGRQINSAQYGWIYRMINTHRPLEEKMTLFWHGLFATAYFKAEKGRTMVNQISMLRRHCLGDFRTLLIELAKDAAMIHWLDNQFNTNEVHNENFGRELLELFSMGRGNYTEDDVKNCARAFTGWGLKRTIPGFYPYAHFDLEFEFYPDKHDNGEKVILGERGNFDGPDVIDIILRQPATATFIARRLYQFFVADRPDADAIAEIASALRASQYDIRAAMRTLFMSDAFRSQETFCARVKYPVELVVGVTRLTGDFTYPEYDITPLALACRYMGQDLMNPPSVEGWHTGKEWIDTGNLVERINFAADQVGDPSKPGIRRIIDELRVRGHVTPEQFIDQCIELVGPLAIQEGTYASLVRFAEQAGVPAFDGSDDATDERLVVRVIQLIVSTREYQMA